MAERTVALAGRKEWIGLAVLALPCLLYSMDLTVLNLAVPHLTVALGPSSTELLWIVDIYGFLVAGSLITMGTLGDRIGRRKLLLIGAVAFGAASIIAAFAQTAAMLIAARAVLGVAAATIAPSTLSLISNMFPDERQRSRAIGIWVASFSAGGALGPMLGGVLLEQFWWGSVFLLAVPVMVIILILGPRLLPEYKDPVPGTIDLRSAALSIAAVLAVIWGVKQIAADGASASALAAIAGGVAIGAAFVRRQRELAHPLIDLGLFRVRPFTVCLLLYLLGAFAAFGTFLAIAQYLQLVLGLGPLEAGLWIAPSGGAFIVGSLVAPALLRWLHKVDVMAVGLALAAVGVFVLSRLGGTPSLALLEIGYLTFGFGMSLTFTHAVDVVVGSAPPERAGSASAIAETGAELGGAVGIALLGSLINALSDDAMARGSEPGAAGDFARAMGTTAMICAIVLVAAAAAAWRLIPRR